MHQDRLALARAIQGRSDEEITELVGRIGGVDPVLETILAGVQEMLNPDRATDCIVGYEISHRDETRQFKYVIRGGAVRVAHGDLTDARVVMALSLPDYVRLAVGQLDVLQAFMDGRLRLRGDIAFADRFRRMFVTSDGRFHVDAPDMEPGNTLEAHSVQAVPQHAAACFGCSTTNPDSLRMRWRLDGENLVAEVTLRDGLDGPPAHAHGGIIAAVLDEAMAAHAQHLVPLSVTTELSVRYQRLVPLGVPLLVVSSLTESSLASTRFRAVIVRDGCELAKGTARFQRPLLTRIRP
jgi:acyl-coenzyme A thioesterase PaaI-like protein/putative sterol carrier protein